MALTKTGTDGLKDDAVSLAKMAGGTDGQIITYDASGNPTAVGPGTDGQVLTSTGAGSPPAFEAIPAQTPEGEAIKSTTNSNESTNNFLRADGDGTSSWQKVEGSVIRSTGETGTSKFLRIDGDNTCSWQEPPAGGIDHIYTWNNAGFSMSAGDQYMTANWGDTNANESSTYSDLGSGMSESSGVFTFPSTGHWLIQWRVFVYVQNTYSRWTQLRIYTTTNNSSYSQRTTTGNNQWNADGIGNGVVYDSLKTEMIFDVTNTTNCKVKFWISTASTTQVSGSYGSLVHFVKLADT